MREKFNVPTMKQDALKRFSGLFYYYFLFINTVIRYTCIYTEKSDIIFMNYMKIWDGFSQIFKILLINFKMSLYLSISNTTFLHRHPRSRYGSTFATSGVEMIDLSISGVPFQEKCLTSFLSHVRFLGSQNAVFFKSNPQRILSFVSQKFN